LRLARAADLQFLSWVEGERADNTPAAQPACPAATAISHQADVAKMNFLIQNNWLRMKVGENPLPLTCAF
jgi:hypothetical protein